MQDKNALEQFYLKTDPWKYKSNKEDEKRKKIILDICAEYAPKGGYKKALDIGAGEGWITGDLPAEEIYGFEISDNASERFPENVKRLQGLTDLVVGSYDLVTVCGVMYKQYDYLGMALLAMASCNGILVTCNIKKWEKYRFPEYMKVYEGEFPYRSYIERLAVYDLSSTFNR